MKRGYDLAAFLVQRFFLFAATYGSFLVDWCVFKDI